MQNCAGSWATSPAPAAGRAEALKKLRSLPGSRRRIRRCRSRSRSRPFAAANGRKRIRAPQSSPKIYPDDARVRRLQTDLRLHHAFELQTEFHVTKEYGGNSSDTNQTSNSPGSGTDWTAHLLFTTGRRIRGASWAPGSTTQRRQRKGGPCAIVSAPVSSWHFRISPFRRSDGPTKATCRRPGASLAIAWKPTDHWRFDLGAKILAGDTPLRAVLNDITANSANIGVTYAWHESRSLAVGVSGYDFSDGNRRAAAHLYFAQKVVDIPHLDVTLRPEIYASTKTQQRRPLFQPGTRSFRFNHVRCPPILSGAASSAASVIASP